MRVLLWWIAISSVFSGGFVAGIWWILSRQERDADTLWERIQVDLAVQAATTAKAKACLAITGRRWDAPPREIAQQIMSQATMVGKA